MLDKLLQSKFALMQQAFLKYNYLEHTLFDTRLTARHLSLYLALVYFHQRSGFKNPVWILRAEVMELSRIQSRMTFYHCLRDLSRYGYIRYLPSYDRMKGSLVYFNRLHG